MPLVGGFENGLFFSDIQDRVAAGAAAYVPRGQQAHFNRMVHIIIFKHSISAYTLKIFKTRQIFLNHFHKPR